MSYRKNKVGINYDFPADDTDINAPSLVIGSHDTSKKIYFVGVNNGERRLSSFDLTTGEFDNIFIDGGSW